jgi:hypothetical protein
MKIVRNILLIASTGSLALNAQLPWAKSNPAQRGPLPANSITVGHLAGIQNAYSTPSQGIIINMGSFGADPTGVNDSAAVTRAVLSSLGAGPATLYFPTGTYRFASYGATREECVRINASISLLGDGPGLTIFTDDVTPACVAQFGFFWSMGTAVRDDYSFETDPGYPLNATSTPLGSTTLTMAATADAVHYAAGQYVYLRGTSLPQNGEYHGELNIVTGVNLSAGTLVLAWPLSSDFTKDTGLVLNLVTTNEVLSNIQVSGITFNFHNNAILAAQVLGLNIFNNQFLYSGATAGNEVSQFNQIRNAAFYNNVVSNPTGNAMDLERNSNDWNIHDNSFYGPIDAGEGGANMNVHNNTIVCENSSTNACVRFGGTTGNTLDNNRIFASGSGAYALMDVSGAVTSPGTVFSNNWIVAPSSRAIVAQTQGTKVSGNTIYSGYVGIDVNATNVTVSNNTITLTAPEAICLLVEGSSDQNTIAGLSCQGYGQAYGLAIYVANAGPQLVLTGVTGTNLQYGIYIGNAASNPASITNCSFTTTLTPYYPSGLLHP